ncbi:hypothetical protein Ciccas_008508 [Cichlidogyrus casuarinus]|uniref:UBR-type domain-containing protein n=1 Tax=Cichlidogyrus casuarinus TaxID=1844966 RepID=A0ABD2Q093_9PLAT
MSNDPEDDRILTLEDFEQESRENNILIYGGVDSEPQCSFINGYLKRQALFSCKTCLSSGSELAGICYHCSVVCHDGHELVEIYTKRNFRCDCGNKKFAGNPICQLWEEKDDCNLLNIYNHNFNGLYCNCDRPYPEDDNDHVNLHNVVKPSDNNEFTCNKCIRTNCFILAYKLVDESTSEKKVKVPLMECKLDQALLALSLDGTDIEWKDADFKAIFDMKEEELSGKFWPADWRSTILCKCEKCKNLYSRLELDFLLDPEDTWAHYTEVAEAKLVNDEAEVKEALESMPRPMAIELVSGMNDFKDAFLEMIKEKEKSGDKIVREEDVKKMVEQLGKRMRN